MIYPARFSEKLITEYVTSSRLVTPKPCYLFSSLVAPHVFSVDCQARLRNGEMVTSDILLNLKTQYEQPSYDCHPPIYFNRGLYVELVGEILEVLDDCGDTSDISNWSENDDGLAPVDNQVYVKEGSHSMALGVDASLVGGIAAYWVNSISLGDLSQYQNDWGYLWFYLPTLDHFNTGAVCLRYYLGSGATDYIRFSWAKGDLSVGWNLLKCDFDNPESSGGTVDWSAIDYQNIRIIEKTGNTDDFTLYVDSIMLVRPFPGATDGITEGVTVQYLIE